MRRSNDFSPAGGRQAAKLILLSTVVLQSHACNKELPRIPPAPAHPVFDRSSACTGPWIGILKQETPEPEPRREKGEPVKPKVLECPEGWDWLFSTDSGEPPPPGLQRFCRQVAEEDPRYEYQRIENPFVEYPPFEDIQRDCRIVGPAAQTPSQPSSLTSVLRDRFVREARGIGPQNLAASSDQARLVIVDSVQDDTNPEDRECAAVAQEGDLECSPHGEVLVRLARELLCPDNNCGVQIRTRRALTWTHEIRPANMPPLSVELQPKDDPPSTTQGGSSGYVKDLALAIRREVEEWWEEEERPKLVLNLSVGWEPIHAASLEVLGETVQASIQDAACRGALVVAAAGNRVTGFSDLLEAPLLPAAWEQELARSPQDCELLLEESAQPATDSITPYRPLVFAVGGVQHDNQPLSNSRPNATPPLVAFGDHAAASDPNPGEPQTSKILTGTSVSTLVVSAAAAEHWRQDPGLSSFDVMKALRDGGQEVGLPVDFSLELGAGNPPLQTARRIFVHPPGPASPPPNWPPTFEYLVAGSLQQIDLPWEAHLVGCDPKALKASTAPPSGTEPCPQRFFDLRSQPWLGPQPGANHCSGCGYSEDSPGTLMLKFNPDFRVEGKLARLDDFTLIVGEKAYRLPMDGFWLGDALADPKRFVFTGFDLEDPPHPMYLVVRVNGRHAALAPILQVLGDEE